MKSRDFVVWLKGYLDIQKPTIIAEENVKEIREKLTLVFKKDIDPSYSDSSEVQDKMQEIHDGSNKKPRSFNRNNPIVKC